MPQPTSAMCRRGSRSARTRCPRAVVCQSHRRAPTAGPRLSTLSAGARTHVAHRQPAQLLMNTVTSQVSQFTDDSVRCSAGSGRARACTSGCTAPASLRAGPEPPAHRRRRPRWPGAERLGPDDYPSRAQYGHYLEWVFPVPRRERPRGPALRRPPRDGGGAGRRGGRPVRHPGRRRPGSRALPPWCWRSGTGPTNRPTRSGGSPSTRESTGCATFRRPTRPTPTSTASNRVRRRHPGTRPGVRRRAVPAHRGPGRQVRQLPGGPAVPPVRPGAGAVRRVPRGVPYHARGRTRRDRRAATNRCS